MATYEVVIIGAGPSGLFAALSLENLGVGKALLVEQGPDLDERHRDGPGGLLCGWGGAGAYSDGKLILSPEVGGFLSDLISLDDLNALIQEVDSIYLSLGASPETFGGDPDTLELLKTNARHAGMIFIPTRLRLIGTENCKKILSRLKERLTGHVEIRTHCRAQRIPMVKDGAVTGGVLGNEAVGGARDYVELPLLLKAKGKCTTDHISMARPVAPLPRPSRQDQRQPLDRRHERLQRQDRRGEELRDGRDGRALPEDRARLQGAWARVGRRGRPELRRRLEP